jgi:hypothetical protein
MQEDRLLPLTIYGLTKMDEELETMLVGGFYKIQFGVSLLQRVRAAAVIQLTPYRVMRFGTSHQVGTVIYEDSLQLKEVIHVRDVVQGNLLAMERSEANYQVLSGQWRRVERAPDLGQSQSSAPGSSPFERVNIAAAVARLGGHLKARRP